MDDSDYQFRAMLKSLDDGLTSDDICVLKFLCQDSLPASKLDNIHGTLDLLSELERAHLIQKGDLQLLAELLSHGEAGKVFGTDCLPISIHSILSKFKPSHCPSLKDKPKIFFIQACGGGRKDDVKDESLGFEALPLIDGVGDPDPGHDLETDYAGRLSIVTNIPRSPDFLLGLATVPGFVSYRSKSSGSWYIQALCKALHKYHNTEDLWTILTEVNNKVSKMQQTMKETIAHQMPLPASTLCKKVYLRTESLRNDSGGARR